MSFFSNLFQKKPKQKEIQKPFEEVYNDLGIFKYTNEGFIVELDNAPHTINWSEIDKIVAYKKDLVAYDLVVMEIVVGENALKINEETPGWFQMIIKQKEIFETIPQDWELNIVQPAFAKNYTVLYERK